MWGQLIIDTLTRPRAAARQVMAASVPQVYVLQGALLVVCLGMVVNFLALQMLPVTVDAITATMLRNPVLGAVQELVFLAIVSVLTVRVGRLFGGTGRFWPGLTLLVWLNVVAILIELAQLLALALIPPVDALVGIVAFGPLIWLAWLYANFVAELHGFQNPFLVLGGMMLTTVVLVFAILMLLTLLGFTAPEMS